jgi:hypothetical protein
MIVCLCLTSSARGQDGNATHKTKTGTSPSPPARIKRPQPRPAILTLTISPTDSSVQLDNSDLSETVRTDNGLLNITVSPGSHILIVRHLGYSDRQITLELNRGENDPVGVALEPLPGRLSVSPNPDGTYIEVREAGARNTLVTSESRISNLSLAAGNYDIVGSKPGYLTKSRKVTIAPGEHAHIELLLEPEPKPEPTPQVKSEPILKPSFVPDSATRISISKEGKDLIVVLTGRSGATMNPVGTIDVIVNPGDSLSGSSRVNGLLPGFPCRVGLVRLENITNELSFVEAPGTGNEWRRVVVRLRPKDSKRPVHFAINWTLLQQPTSSPTR